MQPLDQVRLLMAKAADDETLVDEVMAVTRISDQIIGFHLQQSAEKLLKAALTHLGSEFRRTHDVRELMDALEDARRPLPAALVDLDTLTPFAVAMRYGTLPIEAKLDRSRARELVRQLRTWVEALVADTRTSAPGPNQSGPTD